MIVLRDLVKQYKNKYALRGINLHIQPGEFVFLVGSSGAGKSTLMKMLYLEERPTRGNVYVAGIDIGNLAPSKIPSLRRCMGIVFQDYKLLQNHTVYDNIAYVTRTMGISSKEIESRVFGALKVVGLEDKYKSKPCELSGGEQQRVSIARAIVNGPPLLIADEPTGNLDSRNGREVMNLLSELNKEGTTIVMVTHSEHDASYADRSIHLFDGQVVAERSQ